MKKLKLEPPQGLRDLVTEVVPFLDTKGQHWKKSKVLEAAHHIQEMYAVLYTIEGLCEMVGDTGSINPGPLGKDVRRILRKVRRWK